MDDFERLVRYDEHLGVLFDNEKAGNEEIEKFYNFMVALVEKYIPNYEKLYIINLIIDKMTKFKGEQEKLIIEIEKSNEEISSIEKQLIQIRQDKLFYKRKEDTPNFDKTLEKEINLVNRINFLLNNINILKNNLKNLKNQEIKSIKTRSKMDKVLMELSLGHTRVEASKNCNIPISSINKWYSDGKNNKDVDSIYFYDNAKLYESFYFDFFNIFKNEFKHKNKIHLLRSFVPDSYPQRLDRFYNENSTWFSMLTLRDGSSIYYFGLIDDKFPRLMLYFDRDYHKSNFRLFNDEVIVLLQLDEIDRVKKDFKIYSDNDDSDLYHVSLGKLHGGELSHNIEVLIRNHIV